jgi:hypothetical protein
VAAWGKPSRKRQSGLGEEVTKRNSSLVQQFVWSTTKAAVCIRMRTWVQVQGDARGRKVGQEQMSTKTCPKSSKEARCWE